MVLDSKGWTKQWIWKGSVYLRGKIVSERDKIIRGKRSKLMTHRNRIDPSSPVRLFIVMPWIQSWIHWSSIWILEKNEKNWNHESNSRFLLSSSSLIQIKGLLNQTQNQQFWRKQVTTNLRLDPRIIGFLIRRRRLLWSWRRRLLGFFRHFF